MKTTPLVNIRADPRNLVIICLALMLSIVIGFAVARLPLYWITALAGGMFVLLVMLRPDYGIIVLLVLLYLPVLPVVKVGGFEISVTALPVVFMALASVLHAQWRRLSLNLSRWQAALLALGLAVFLLSILTSFDPLDSLKMLPNLLIYLLTVFVVLTYVRTPPQLVLIAKTIILLAVASILWKNVDSILSLPRLTGPNGIIFRENPAVALCLAVLILPVPGFNRRWRLFAWLALSLVVLDMVLAQTRGAWLAGLMMLALILFQERRRNLTILISILIVLAAVFLAYSQILERNIQQTQTTVEAVLGVEDPASISSDDLIRLEARNASLRMFTAKPVMGWGPGQFNVIKPYYVLSSTKEANNPGAFNSYLVILVEIGLVGLAVVALFFVVPFIRVFRHLGPQAPPLTNLAYAFVVALVGLAVHLFFIDLIYNSYVWIHIGLAMSAIEIARRAQGNA